MPCRRKTKPNQTSLELGLGVASVVDFYAFWNKPFTAFGPTTTEDVLAVVGGHTLAEAELTFAGPLGWLISALAHDESVLDLKRKGKQWLGGAPHIGGMSCFLEKLFTKRQLEYDPTARR